ncbi:MAG: 1-acyl-sn-glycerol-3-phosphate acyltransferase [Planctomycetota bacterium]
MSRLVRFPAAVLVLLTLGFVAGLAWLIPVRRARSRVIRRLCQCWATALLRVLSVRVRLDPPDADLPDPALYAANHSSYLDILVVMSISPGVFVSKLGVAWWPLIGQLAAASETLFVNRRDRFRVGRLVDKVRDRLRSGRSVVFFPEATSGSGDSLLPFKPSLFAAARCDDGPRFPVQPLVIRYESVAGEPLNTENRDRVLWYGGRLFLPHVWNLLRGPGVEVTVRALPARPPGESRREFARELREEMLKEIKIPETVP